MPVDYTVAWKLVRAAEYEEPVILWFNWDAVTVVYDESQIFEIGKAIPVKDGRTSR